jgi:carbohydrate-selective porin OprB
MLPKFSSDDVADDEDTSYLVEALYKFPLSDNISITPGAYAVFNPDHNSDNETVYVGVVRTTFEF